MDPQSSVCLLFDTHLMNALMYYIRAVILELKWSSGYTTWCSNGVSPEVVRTFIVHQLLGKAGLLEGQPSKDAF